MTSRPAADLDNFRAIADAIATLFFPHAEVVLHDLRTQKIDHIANNLSKRAVGDDAARVGEEVRELVPRQRGLAAEMIALQPRQQLGHAQELPLIVPADADEVRQQSAGARGPLGHRRRRRRRRDEPPDAAHHLAQRAHRRQVGGADGVGARQPEAGVRRGGDGKADEEPVEAADPRVLRDVAQVEGGAVLRVEAPPDAGRGDELGDRLAVREAPAVRERGAQQELE